MTMATAVRSPAPITTHPSTKLPLLHDSISSGSADFMSEHELRFLERLQNLKPVGHTEQKKMLKQAFERVKMGGMSEVLFLHGESGVGKSKTANEVFRKQTVCNTKKRNSKKSKHKTTRCGHFVSGKFDQIQTNSDPYSAIVAAFTELCDTIEQSEDRINKEQVRDNLLEALSDDEAVILIKLVPNLTRLVGIQDSAVAAIGTTSYLRAFVKFKLLCRKFLSAVATDRQPIVLLIDDLQWADEGSIEVFKSLCCDMGSKHVLIVGVYRDDEGFVAPRNMERILPSTDVNFPRLGVKDVNKIISAVTEMDSKASLPLAQVVHSKTLGNPQFVKLFLESMYSEKLLTFSIEKDKWEFDVAEVETATTDASDVLVAAKINRLSSSVRDILKFASCLGFEFELEHLRVVLVAEHENFTGKKRLPGIKLPASQVSPSRYREVLLKLLDKARKYGVITDGRRRGTFSFSHDKVFETVYLSLPSGRERQQLHVRIGRILLESFPEDNFVSFLAVDHLNQGGPSIGSLAERLELAKLNLSRAQRAVEEFSAFDRARDFIVKGLSLFSDDDLWGIDYKLALDMHTIGAESSVVGKSPERFVQKAIVNGRSLQDKIPLYMTLMNYYRWQNKLDESVMVGMNILKLLGEKVPEKAGKTHVAWEFVLAKRAVGNRSDKEILSLPQLKDSTKIAVLRTLREVGNNAYFKQPTLMMTCILRILRLTMRYGIYPEIAPVALASYGYLHFHLKNDRESKRFLELALIMLDKQHSRCIRAQCSSVIFGLGLHRWYPIEDMYRPLVDGYAAGDKYGDTAFGLICAKMSCDVQLLLGEPLGTVEKKLGRYVELAKAHNRKGVLALACPLHQRILNLMGRSEDPKVLSGTAMEQTELIKELEGCGNEAALVALLENVFQLNCLFDDWDKAYLYYQEVQKYPGALKSRDPFLTGRQSRFFFALFGVVWHERTGNKRYRRSAHNIFHEMREQQAGGSPNYESFVSILDAELASNKNSKEIVDARFRKVVNDCKYIHLKALAHERAASVIQASFGDRVLAKEHLLAAKDYYRQWQAKAKVRDVEGKLKYL